MKSILISLFVLMVAAHGWAEEKLTQSWVNMTVMNLSSMKQDTKPTRITGSFSPDAKISVYVHPTINEETFDFNDDEKHLTLTPDGFLNYLKERANGNRLYTLSRKKIWSAITTDATKATTRSFLLEGTLVNDCIRGHIAEEAVIELINGKALITELYWEVGS